MGVYLYTALKINSMDVIFGGILLLFFSSFFNVFLYFFPPGLGGYGVLAGPACPVPGCPVQESARALSGTVPRWVRLGMQTFYFFFLIYFD